MAFIDPSTILWANICSLMGYGPNDKPPSIDTVQRKVGVGRGTVQRIKEQSAATQIDSLITIACKLGVPVWKLLQPSSEAQPAPAAASSKAMEIAEMFDKIPPELQVHVEALVHALQPAGSGTFSDLPSLAPSASHLPSQ